MDLYLRSSGSTNNKLNWRHDLSFDSSSKTLCIAVHFDPISNTGLINGSAGNSQTLLNQPCGVTLDPMGTLYIADNVNQRIQFFFAGESLATTIVGTTNRVAANSTLLNRPVTVKLDNQLNLYVVGLLTTGGKNFYVIEGLPYRSGRLSMRTLACNMC